VTAAGVLAAIDRSRFDVVAIGITRDGAWTLVSDDPADWAIAPDGTFPEVRDTGTRVVLPARAGQRTLGVIRDARLAESLPVDVVFPLLHGSWGEDGTIQGALELVDLPYVGSGVLASATAMDKAAAKLRLLAAGVPVVPFVEIDARRWHPTPQAVDDVGAQVSWPAFVKPSRGGSSLGITRVAGPGDLPAAVAEAARYDPRILVEPLMRGREIECAVMGGRGTDPARVAVPGEIVVLDRHEFYDYDAKYTDAGAVALRCPTDLPPGISESVRTMAAQAFDALGCEGLARVDFFYCPPGAASPGAVSPGAASPDAASATPHNPAGLVVNEVNTMPGLTPFSFYPRMWEVAGVTYGDMVGELIDLALDRPVGLR
jgi:D-alanine-D-alanine ligase